MSVEFEAGCPPSETWRSGNGAALFASALLFAVTAIVILRERPYFGNMQDGQDLAYMEARGQWARFLDFDHQEFGTLSHTPFFGNSLLTRIGLEFSAVSYYLVNALFVFAFIFSFWMAFKTLLVHASGVSSIVFIATSFLWPFTADLLIFPTLVEKYVIVGAAGLLYWVGTQPHVSSATIRWVSFALLNAIAFTTKLHILVFLPGLALGLVLSHPILTRRRRFDVALALAAWVGLALILIHVARGGTYTRERKGNFLDLPRLLEWRFLLLLIASVGVTALILLVRPGRLRFDSLDKREHLVPVVFLFAMVGSFLVWDVYQRHLSIASVMFGSALAVVVSRFPPRLGRPLALILLLMSSFWLANRLPYVYSSLGSFGDFIRSPEASSLSEEEAVVYSSCFEARFNYDWYADRESVGGIQFGWLDDPGDPRLNADSGGPGVLVLADHVLCPLEASARFGDSRIESVLWESDRARGFRLIQIVGN